MLKSTVDVTGCMRLGTLNVRGGSNDALLREVMAGGNTDVLCVTETYGSMDSIHHLSSNDLHVAGPRVRGQQARHCGGVRLISSSSLNMRYRAHYKTQDAQVLVATIQGGLVAIAAYFAPLHGKATIQSTLDWVKPWMRSDAILFGDLNARHRIWDSECNAFGRTLNSWAEQHGATIYAPSSITCLTALGASAVDLFVSRSPRLDNVEVIPGMWDFATDHRLVVAQVCPNNENTACNIPLRIFKDKAHLQRAVESYKKWLPLVTRSAPSADTPSQLEKAVSALQTAILRPWLQFCKEAPRRFNKGWSRDLDRMANERTRLLRRAAKGDAIAKLAAREIDKIIKRKQRARARAIERIATIEADRHLDTYQEGDLDRVVRATLTSQERARRPSPSAYLAYLRRVFRDDPSIECDTFTLDTNFESTVEQSIMAMARGRSAGPDGIPAILLQITPSLASESLCAIWRAVGRLQYVPSALTIGRVTPVYKKGDHKHPENYRPICVLNVIRRAVTSAIDHRIRWAVTLHQRQWGFRKNVSTEHAIAHLDARRREGANHIVVLDMKGAYDRTPRHKILAIVRRRLTPDLAGMVSATLGQAKFLSMATRQTATQSRPAYHKATHLAPRCSISLWMSFLLKWIDRSALQQRPRAATPMISQSLVNLEKNCSSTSTWQTHGHQRTTSHGALKNAQN